MHRLAKATYRFSRYRGFESPPLRQLPLGERLDRGTVEDPRPDRSGPANSRAGGAATSMTRARTTTLLLLAAAAAACNTPGPRLRLENPERHAVFLDGRRVATERAPDAARAPDALPDGVAEVPFRYYGATRWDVLPTVSEDDGVPRFDRAPQSAVVALPPPANPWLFPLDFPLELIRRTWSGRRDVVVEVRAAPKEPLQGEIPQETFGELSARARAARGAR